jgi:hypothetical protein
MISNVVFREMTPADRHFVVSSWAQSFRAADTAGFIQVEDWYPVMDAQVSKALDRPDVRTIVACNARSPDQLHGFITADTEERPPLVYYVFVKEAYRRGGNGRLWKGPGLARQLFAAIGVDPSGPFNFVCSTPWERTLKRKIPLARWRPLWGRFPKAERKQGR